VLSFCCIDERFVVEVPHNHEVTTNVTWDLQLMRDIPIQLPILVSNNPHLLVQSCTSLQHADECLGQWQHQSAVCIRVCLSLMQSMSRCWLREFEAPRYQ
jgi:hypothetical protein